MRKNILTLSLIAGLLSLDIVSKYLIVGNILEGGRIDFLGGFLRLTLVYNEGFVFGLFQGHKTLALIVALVVLGLMVFYYFYEKDRSTLFCVAMGMITAGALGNIIDRMVPDRKGVVDFISIGVDGIYRWPSFNVADSSIVIGAFLLIIVFYQQERLRKKLEAQTK